MRILGEFGYSLFLIVSSFVALTIVYRRQWPAILQIVVWTASIAACIAALLFRGFVGVGIDDVVAKYVTSSICGIYHLSWCKDAEDLPSNRPTRITSDIRKLDFFDSATGQPRVWYSKISSGSFELFNARGYHPVTSEPLLPVSKEVVTEIMKWLAGEEAARKLAEDELRRAAAADAVARQKAEEERRQAELDAQRRADEVRTQAEEERKRAELEARRQVEESRRRAELEARRQAEEERKQAEAEARRRAEEERKLAQAEAKKRAEEAELRRRLQQVKMNVVQFDANLNMYSVQVAFALENHTGVPISIGLVSESTYAGNCPLGIKGVREFSLHEIERLKLNPSASSSLQQVPENGRLVASGENFSFVVAQCRFPAGSEVRTSVVVAAAKDVFVLPVSAKIRN